MRKQHLVFKLVGTHEEQMGACDVRRRVFIEEQGVAEGIEMDDMDAVATHVVAKSGDMVVGTARFRLIGPDIGKIERMAVLKEWRRKRVGDGLLRFVIDELRKLGIKEATLHAQARVKDFYRANGFEEVGETFMEADIEHIEMRRLI